MKKYLFIGIILVYVICIMTFIKHYDKRQSPIIETNNIIKPKKEYYVSLVPVIKEPIVEEQVIKSFQDNVVIGKIKNENYVDEDITKIEEENTNYNDVNVMEIESESSLSLKNEEQDFKEENTKDKEQINDEAYFPNEQTINESIEEISTVISDNQDVSTEVSVDLSVKNGFAYEDGETYFYENNNKVSGAKVIDGVNHYFSPSGKYLGIEKVKVVDVSYYQKDIDWDMFAQESDCYGVILRLGYYETLDKKFERNLSELKRLNIPYGIYLFSYSTTMSGAKKEADFTNNMISKYDINPILGIYYDVESWNTKTSSSNDVSKTMYDDMIGYYIDSVSNYTNYKYKVKVYSGRWYAMNRLGALSKKHVDWVAEYNSTCKYDGEYSLWQYTSKGSIPGILGNVDISYIIK